jgi:DNA-binding response OmpR family regulator
MAVLILYEDGPTRAAILGALAREGIEARTADNVFRAVADFTARPSGTVVMSVGELGERDLAAISVLREIAPDVQVILGFTPTQRELAARGLEAGADAYLLEPFYMEEMVALVRRGVDRRAGPGPTDEASTSETKDVLAELAADVAHEVNNQLQIALLTLDGKSRLSRAKLRAPLNRIEGVTKLLSLVGRLADEPAGPIDVPSILDAAVDGLIESGLREIEATPPALGWPEALGTAFRGLAQRAAVFGREVACGCRETLIGGESFVEVVIASRPFDDADDVSGDEIERPVLVACCRLIAARLRGHLTVDESPDRGGRYEWLVPIVARGGVIA